MNLSSPYGDICVGDAGGEYVLLNFWKSTDAPSRKRANDYTAWLRRHENAGLRFVSVNLDESPEMYREIVRRDSLIPSTQYHVGGDTARAIYNAFGLEYGLGTMLVNPDGKIIAHNPSWDELNKLTAVFGNIAFLTELVVNEIGRCECNKSLIVKCLHFGREVFGSSLVNFFTCRK